MLLQLRVKSALCVLKEKGQEQAVSTLRAQYCQLERFFKKNFNFEMRIELQRQDRNFLKNSHPASPNISILCNPGACIQTKVSTLVQRYQLHGRLHADFPRFSTNCPAPCVSGPSPFSYHIYFVSSNCVRTSGSPCFLKTSALLKSTGQVFSRMSLNLGLSNIFSLDQGLWIWGRIPQRRDALVNDILTRGDVVLTWPVTAVHFDPGLLY